MNIKVFAVHENLKTRFPLFPTLTRHTNIKPLPHRSNVYSEDTSLNELENNIDPTASSADAAPRKKTMTEAALAANRDNARKSTGPRTAAGKARSASNAFKHGIYSPDGYDKFVSNPNLALEVTTNYIEQFQPITPIEHSLVQQLVHQQLRFIQTQWLYNQAVNQSAEDLLLQPVPFMPQLLRELDRLPSRMLRTVKAIRTEQSLRDENTGIEAIDDQPAIPPPQNLANEAIPAPGQEVENYKITPHILLELFAGRVVTAAETQSIQARHEKQE